MVRSEIPDSEEESDQISPHSFTSLIRAVAVPHSSPSARAASQNHDNKITFPAGTSNDVNVQLLLGTGSTDSVVFQQIYNQHQLSTDATLPTPVSQTNNQEQVTSATTEAQKDSLAINPLRKGRLTPPRPSQGPAPSSATSSSAPTKRLKRSKTNVADSSFTSPEAPKFESKVKRAKSMKSFQHTIEGSSQDITVPVADTGEYTKLSPNFTYHKVQNEKDILSPENGKGLGKDIYDFPGSSAANPPRITKSKTTMDKLAQKQVKTYGKVRRTKTMVPPSSSPDAPIQKRRRRDSDAGERDSTNNAILPSSPPVQDPRPRTSLRDNIKRKKEEKKAATESEKQIINAIDVEGEADTIVVASTTSSLKKYGKIKRSKTGIPASSPAASAIESYKRPADDNYFVEKQKERKTDVQPTEDEPVELPRAKRYHGSIGISVGVERGADETSGAMKAVPSEIVVLSSSQDDPVDQIPDTIVTPTASMPKPLLKSSTEKILVTGTKSQDKNPPSNLVNSKKALQVDSDAGLVVDSDVSLVKATKSSSSKSSFVGHGHPGTPKLPCFDSPQEQANATRSVLEKVGEIVNSPAAHGGNIGEMGSDASSSLSISFDKGLTSKSMVIIPALTDSQKEQYQPISRTSSDKGDHDTNLPRVMSPARVEKWSGASSTIANSTWKDRDSGGHSADKRAPTIEPLSSQPRPSSTRPNKRSKTGVEHTTPTRRGRSASVLSDSASPLADSEHIAKFSSKEMSRRKTMATHDGPARSSAEPRRTHVVKTITTYEKLKDPDESAPSFPEIVPSSERAMADTQPGSTRGTKRKLIGDGAEAGGNPQEDKRLGKSQEELDFEMAKRLQEEMDRDDCEPETRTKRRPQAKQEVAEQEPEIQSSQEAGLPPPDMYKPRLSSRRSKSLSAKLDPNAVELFVDGLPRPTKRKGKKSVKDKEIVAETKAVGKENVEPPKDSMIATSAQIGDASGDTPMEDAPPPGNGEDDIIVVSELPKSVSNKVKQANQTSIPARSAAASKKIGRAASKSVSAATVDTDDEDAIIVPKKRGRDAKVIIDDTDASADELLDMGIDDQQAGVTNAPIRGRSVSKAAAAKPAPKSKEIVDTDDEGEDDEELPVKPAKRPKRGKQPEKSVPAKPSAKSKEIVDSDEDEDEEGPVKPVSPLKAPPPAAPTPAPKPRGVTRKVSTPGFKAPTMTRTKSTSVDNDIPQTPRKDKESGQNLTPKSTPPGTVSHSPLRGGVVPLRVGLSKKTRLPSLLKIIRK